MTTICLLRSLSFFFSSRALLSASTFSLSGSREPQVSWVTICSNYLIGCCLKFLRLLLPQTEILAVAQLPPWKTSHRKRILLWMNIEVLVALANLSRTSSSDLSCTWVRWSWRSLQLCMLAWQRWQLRMASWSYRLIQERAIEEVWQDKARGASLLLLPFAHIDFLGVGQIGFELLCPYLLISEILLCDLLIQMIWMVLLPHCISCIFSFFLNRQNDGFWIQNAWGDRLWWLTCCPDEAELVYLIDFVNVLSPIHFLNSCLIDLPFYARRVRFVLVVHKQSGTLFLSATCGSSTAFLLASDMTMFWMC